MCEFFFITNSHTSAVLETNYSMVNKTFFYIQEIVYKQENVKVLIF